MNGAAGERDRLSGGAVFRPACFTEIGWDDTIVEQAEVAQLVEQLIRNQQVVGSSPTFGSRVFCWMKNPGH